jgi:hypothetical protein
MCVLMSLPGSLHELKSGMVHIELDDAPLATAVEVALAALDLSKERRHPRQ